MKKTKRVLLWCIAFTAGFALSAASAFADTIGDAAQAVVDRVVAGSYTEAAILGIVLAVAAFRKLAPQRWAFWRGNIGGTLLVLIFSFGAALAAAMKNGDGFQWVMLWTAFKFAAFSSGGYTLVKRLGGLLLAKLPIPGWAQSALSAALWLFQPRGAKAVENAEKAGEKAASDADAPGAGPTGTLR